MKYEKKMVYLNKRLIILMKILTLKKNINLVSDRN